MFKTFAKPFYYILTSSNNKYFRTFSDKNIVIRENPDDLYFIHFWTNVDVLLVVGYRVPAPDTF